MSTVPAPAPNNTPAPVEAPNIVASVAKQVRGYLEKGTLFLPLDYCPDNALKSAWLILQTTVDKDKNPALRVCSETSIASTLLDMVIMGLNPTKKQCYFIVRGKELTLMRSYFGDEAVARRVIPGIEVYSGVVYDKEEFEFDTIRGRKHVTKHKQTLATLKNNIVAAYCGIATADGEDLGAVIMTLDRIKKSWAMNPFYKDGGGGTHDKFTDAMALRTVIRKRCLPVINSSDDSMLREAIRRSQEDRVEAELDEQIALNGNGTVLAIEAPAQAAEVIPAATAEPVAVVAGGDAGEPGF